MERATRCSSANCSATTTQAMVAALGPGARWEARPLRRLSAELHHQRYHPRLQQRDFAGRSTPLQTKSDGRQRVGLGPQHAPLGRQRLDGRWLSEVLHQHDRPGRLAGVGHPGQRRYRRRAVVLSQSAAGSVDLSHPAPIIWLTVHVARTRQAPTGIPAIRRPTA